MGHRTRARRARAESRTTCPWCKRPLASLVTGQCIYCLRHLPGHGSHMEAAEILRLWEFDSAREQNRRRTSAGPLRRLAPLVAGVLAAALLSGLFALGLRWANGFFARRSVEG
jgi:hypothetical protein